MFQPLIDWFSNAIRSLFSLLDSVGYFLLSGVYNIFFTVANAKIFEGDVINEFFRRIQLILGIIMIFNLAITAINIIINPDLFKDKEKGAGKIVFRIALSLVMLSLVAPINFGTAGDGNDLNTQISNNGILFGFLYQFQDSVMKDNILGKLILGSETETNEGNYGDLDNMSDVGIDLANTVARAFITPTLKDSDIDPDIDPHNITEDDVACSEVFDDYDYEHMDYNALIKYVNDTCESNGGEVYVFSYTPLVGFICAIIMIVIIIGFTLDVAVRSIKLVILRLIAPIPIISYMVPGQEKNGVFSNWVKTLSSTYLDLFIRLIVIYFGAYVIIIISKGNVNLWVNGPGFFTSLLATVFIIIGVLMFMKQAPKFFQDMLGLKGDGKLFSSVAPLLAGAGLLAAKGAAGTYSAIRGNGFMHGASQVHGNGMIHKAVDMYKNLTPKQQEIKKQKRLGQQELNTMHKNWKDGNKLFNNYGSDAFSGLEGDESYNMFDNEEFAASKRAVDAANNRLKAASSAYNIAYANNNLTSDVVKEYEDAQKALKGKEATHESMRKKYYKDAQKEDAYKFRKYNTQDPTRVNRHVAVPNSSASNASSSVHSNRVAPSNVSSSTPSSSASNTNNDASLTSSGIPVTVENKEYVTKSGIVLSSSDGVDQFKKK